MIDEKEFDRRVSHWFKLIMAALETAVHRLINEGKGLVPDDLNDPVFAAAMRRAGVYQAEYLPDEVLEYFLDPLLPEGYFQESSRLEFLLQQALMLKTAQTQAEHCIERARQSV